MVYERNELKADWKPRLVLSANKIGHRTKYHYLALTLMFAGIAALIPHLIDGHVFFLARAYAESVGILLNHLKLFSTYLFQHLLSLEGFIQLFLAQYMVYLLFNLILSNSVNGIYSFTG